MLCASIGLAASSSAFFPMRVWRSPTVFFGDEDAASTADSPRRRSAPLNETSEAVEWPPSYRTAMVRVVRECTENGGAWCMAVA